MSSVDIRLAASARRTETRDFGCWRVEQIGPPSKGFATPDNAAHRNRALALWLDRLRDRPGPRVYRVSPASEIE
ncbi:MAG TPA: hypothetical protein VL985_08635 [Stellaceae bacterium]|nr:hypothetical protein [Stellaceae bacterium]